MRDREEGLRQLRSGREKQAAQLITQAGFTTVDAFLDKHPLEELAKSNDPNMKRIGQVLMKCWDLHLEARQIFAENKEMMSDVIEQYGWPTRSMVGEEGASAAWMIVQHLDDISFQIQCLQLMEQLLVRDTEGVPDMTHSEVNPRHYAYLYDRIAVSEGRKQYFGTQFFTQGEGVVQPHDMDSPEEVDSRRAIFGLRPLQEELARAAERKGAPPQANFN